MVPPPQSIQLPDTCEQVVLCGGPYSNFGAVAAFLATTADYSYRFCLGDMGGFGPLPNRTLDLLRQAEIICIQGNYDHAVGFGLRDCGCGYSDPRDRHFAQVSYDYTYAHTAEDHRQWLRELPAQIVLEWRDCRILLCHGSPDVVNEFVWTSETDDARILDFLARHQVDGICATHTGLPWIRPVTQPSGRPGFWGNVGVLGRPAHEGKPHVYYGKLHFPNGTPTPQPELVPLSYDTAPVAAAMRAEKLPSEFIESLERGIWTTCGEILPPAEKMVQPRVLG
ncbi:MAG: metallophosphoesterase [Leptolyngbyaceae bacterium]|nr:metallophosphoesterase [Leptolyngbyaceae bacterium]